MPRLVEAFCRKERSKCDIPRINSATVDVVWEFEQSSRRAPIDDLVAGASRLVQLRYKVRHYRNHAGRPLSQFQTQRTLHKPELR